MQLIERREYPKVAASPFVTLSAAAAAVGSVVASGLYKSWFAVIALMLNGVAFQLVFLATWAAFTVVRPYSGRAGPWLFIPAAASALAFASSFAIGLLLALFPIYGAIGGAVGGLVGAWVWIRLETHPGSFGKPLSVHQPLSRGFLLGAAIGIGFVLISLVGVLGAW